jgi:hypothetical protein
MGQALWCITRKSSKGIILSQWNKSYLKSSKGIILSQKNKIVFDQALFSEKFERDNFIPKEQLRFEWFEKKGSAQWPKQGCGALCKVGVDKYPGINPHVFR